MRFSLEFNMHLDLDMLNNTIDSVMDDLTMLDPNNIVSIKRKTQELLTNLKRLTELTISVDASYRLASCSYFWIDEDLTDYDYEIGDEKIKLFKQMKFDDFFLSEPMNRFLPQINMSAQDLEVFSNLEKQRKRIHTEILTKAKLQKTTGF